MKIAINFRENEIVNIEVKEEESSLTFLTPEDFKDIENSKLDKEFIAKQSPAAFFKGFEPAD